MNIRSFVFWGRDFLSGSRIREELDDITLLNNRTVQATERRLRLLQDHLKYVTSNVPYYKGLNGRSTLSEFPVLSKEDMRAKQDRMVADGFDISKLHVASTSGSTGTPFRVYQDRGKRQRANAESIYFGQQAGYNVGVRLWYLKLWTARSSHSRIGRIARNIRPVDVSIFREAEARELFRKLRKQKGDSAIVAYSSSLEVLARFVRDHDQSLLGQCSVSAIVGQSEPLSQEARTFLWQGFGTYPVGRYGLEEVGLVAQQEPVRDASYRMNLASHIVEVLQQHSDQPAATGEVGRVVITDLFNMAQPIVRYDTGDLAIVGSYEAGTNFAETLARLDGRSSEQLYDENDLPISSLISYNFWWQFPELLQYQIVQRGRADYVLRLVVNDGFDREPELLNEFRKWVGASARIDVTYDDSTYQRPSGKRQAVVSEYNPGNHEPEA